MVSLTLVLHHHGGSYSTSIPLSGDFLYCFHAGFLSFGNSQLIVVVHNYVILGGASRKS
jgi:hypothetical protein